MCSVLSVCMPSGQKKIAIMWVLGIEVRNSARAASTLNFWAISPALDMALILYFILPCSPE